MDSFCDRTAAKNHKYASARTCVCKHMDAKSPKNVPSSHILYMLNSIHRVLKIDERLPGELMNETCMFTLNSRVFMANLFCIKDRFYQGKDNGWMFHHQDCTLLIVFVKYIQ